MRGAPPCSAEPFSAAVPPSAAATMSLVPPAFRPASWATIPTRPERRRITRRPTESRPSPSQGRGLLNCKRSACTRRAQPPHWRSAAPCANTPSKPLGWRMSAALRAIGLCAGTASSSLRMSAEGWSPGMGQIHVREERGRRGGSARSMGSSGKRSCRSACLRPNCGRAGILTVVKRARLTPLNRRESTCYHADRRPICGLLSNRCLRKV